MAQDAEGARADSGRGGNRKRRYFRRKPGDAATQAETPSATPARSDRSTHSATAARAAQASRDTSGERTGRSSNRRRRKSKGRRSGEGAHEQASVTQAQEINYEPPTSVYIYTHIVRPAGSGNYEFRAEHFSKMGRTLDDYAIDVSPLFDEAARAAARPNMAEIFADFDMGEENDPSAHMDDNRLAVGGDTGLPTYTEDPYGAEDTASSDENEPNGTPDVAIE